MISLVKEKIVGIGLLFDQNFQLGGLVPTLHYLCKGNPWTQEILPFSVLPVFCELKSVTELNSEKPITETTIGGGNRGSTSYFQRLGREASNATKSCLHTKGPPISRKSKLFLILHILDSQPRFD